MTPEEQAENILKTLETQNFADWYNAGTFDSYITGEKSHLMPTEEQKQKIIIPDIIKMFHLKKI